MSTVRASRARSRGGLNRRLASIVCETTGRKCKQTGAPANSILSASTIRGHWYFFVHPCASGLKCRKHCLCAARPAHCRAAEPCLPLPHYELQKCSVVG